MKIIKKNEKKLNIFIGNHQKITSIKDHIDLIKSCVKTKSLKVEVTNQILINSVNFFIEEFSENKLNEELIKIKRKFPKTIFVCLYTELPTKKIIKNFNHVNFNFFFSHTFILQ